jgi:hypothetical protein
MPISTWTPKDGKRSGDAVVEAFVEAFVTLGSLSPAAGLAA